ncbi:MBL fold metallo-hydrolase [Ramlibacter sp. WS9]|uniref:MBL fold metallo-hydrolase n=1 Tax=Ramlibacter sp. WS9 TaxID=1882741 RepID=UPI0011411F23|nr:MBL fold metallo-hydrolase [Ramlibacter sp. WS9]ROZ74965.1 MBL fold metallo-hydrolase [Ramlibacter sp. WS9]
MKRLCSLIVLSLFIAGCASPKPPADLVGRALDAMGGTEALAKLKSLSLKGTVRQADPEQAFEPDGESWHTSSEFELTADLPAQVFRIDWVKSYTLPFPVKRAFSEIVTPQAGYVLGVDTMLRNKQSLANNPPAHAMSGLRVATNQRELLRASPSLLLEMQRHPRDVRARSDVAVAGVLHPALDYAVGQVTYTVVFDPQTALPIRIRTMDHDNIWGDVTYDLVLSDWRMVDGVRIPARRVYELRGKPVQEVQLTQLAINVPIDAAQFEPPAAIKAGAAVPATGHNHHQWVIRRQFIGTYVDSDDPGFDNRAMSSLRLDEVAPGVQFVVGGSHNSLIVEMSDHLIVFDAPVSDGQSRWTLAAAKAKYPGKPVRTLVLTHHHMDHAGGLRTYVAQGATLVVGKGSARHFREVLSASFTHNPDLAATDLSRAAIMEVSDKQTFSDGRRVVSVHLVENPHAAGMLIGYVADQRLGWVTDLWLPGAPLPQKITPLLSSVVNGVKKAGIAPVRFAGGHGSIAPYAPLEALATAN